MSTESSDSKKLRLVSHGIIPNHQIFFSSAMDTSSESEIHYSISPPKFPYRFSTGKISPSEECKKMTGSFRYKLKANDAILASDDHKGLNETLLRDYPNHQFVAGGSTQNSIRAATVTFLISKLIS